MTVCLLGTSATWHCVPTYLIFDESKSRQISNPPHRYPDHNPYLLKPPPSMKILEAQSAVLSNYEVYTHLAANHAKPRSTPQKHSNVHTVLKEVSFPIATSHQKRY